MDSSRPLDNFAFTRTRSTEKVREALAQVYAKPSLEPARTTKRLNASINHCQLQHISLGYCSYGAAVSAEFPAVDRFVQLLLIRGKGEIINGNASVPLAVGSGALISPDMGYKASYDDDCERVILQIDAQALKAKLAILTGATINEPLRMDPRTDFTRPAAQSLREYLPLLLDTLSAANLPLPNWWISQTEQLLMVMFLFGHQHNYSHFLEREALDAAPWQVRRAEEYIEANWQQPISLEALAEVSGVSAFSLFRAFKKSRGYSPMDFASQVRSRRKERC
jgi:hypothetical protein